MRGTSAIEQVRAILSPKGLLLRVALCALGFAVCHLAGLRRFTAFLSGTSEISADGRWLSAFLGIVYIVAYLAATVLAPILAFAALLLWMAGQRRHGR